MIDKGEHTVSIGLGSDRARRKLCQGDTEIRVLNLTLPLQDYTSISRAGPCPRKAAGLALAP